MTAQIYQNQIYQLIRSFKSCSLVNADGALLASHDKKTQALTTTRLVAFQIIKKYLNPQPQDLFVMNDPENGGYSLSQLIFVAAIDPQLYLIWDEHNPLIDFKIPPTPIYEKNKKNEFVWKAVVENNEHSLELKDFFETEKRKIDSISGHTSLIKNLTATKNQNLWLRATQEIFEQQFSNKAVGSFESSFKTNTNQLIKLKYTAEEKQNVKSIALDFTNSSPASSYHAASHVIESALIQKLIQFYQIEKYLTQSVLDKIKIILPPKSIASKAHRTGEFNQEIQSICSQMCLHNLAQLNSQVRKAIGSFEVGSELRLVLKFNSKNFNLNFNQKTIQLPHFELLIEEKKINVSKMQKTDQCFQLCFQILDDQFKNLKIDTRLGCSQHTDILKINDQEVTNGIHPLKKNDVISLKWIF